jgi:2-polyprenyl-3-methyl-5-hydroxy-6-metoxy-1,4-benzoquinol methylase
LILRTVEKGWNEFWAYYWRVTCRQGIPGIREWDNRLVDLIEKTCSLSPPMRILDMGCGGGDQARVFAKRGYSVVGLDIAEPLVQYARKQFKQHGLTGTFVTDDMRNINYVSEFDLCVLLSGTFGFFSDAENLGLLKKIRNALVDNGRVFIMYVTPFRFQKRTRAWHEIDGGYELSEHWFDTETSTYRGTVRLILNDGTVVLPKKEPGYNANEVIRCYTVPEMENLLQDAGFCDIHHLSRRHIDEPGLKLSDGDERDIAVAVKG